MNVPGHFQGVLALTRRHIALDRAETKNYQFIKTASTRSRGSK